MWSREMTDENFKATTRPENVWPEVWTKIGNAAQECEQQEWAIEKPKFDNALRLRGMHFFHRSGRSVTMQRNHQTCEEKVFKKLPNGGGNAVARKEQRNTSLFRKLKSKSREIQQVFQKQGIACIVEAHESTMTTSANHFYRQDHEDDIALRSFHSMTHYNCRSTFRVYSSAASDENSGVRKQLCAEREWKKHSKRFQPGSWTKLRAKKEFILEAQRATYKNVPVMYVARTSPFVPAPRAHVLKLVRRGARTHGDVLSGHGVFESDVTH